jgi:hypothetical protein
MAAADDESAPPVLEKIDWMIILDDNTTRWQEMQQFVDAQE